MLNRESRIVAQVWYDLSKKLKGSLARSAAERAVFHYRIVIPNLTGLDLMLAKQRVKEIEAITTSKTTATKSDIDCLVGIWENRKPGEKRHEYWAFFPDGTVCGTQKNYNGKFTIEPNRVVIL